MKLDVVGRTPNELLGVQRDILERLSGNNGDLWLDRYKRLHRGENPFAELVAQSTPAATWKDELISIARRKLKKFSRAWADQVTAIPDTWTPEFLEDMAKHNMKPVFFPEADITEALRTRKYIKPNSWFYINVAGNIKDDNAAKLRKGWVLADFTIGADYTDGTQVFINDPWARLIAELRGKKLVGAYNNTPTGSRFAITWDEWNDCVLAQMASKLLATRAQTTLERAMEYNFIGNVYDLNRGRFNVWEWFQELFGDSYHLIGGRRDGGGLADVSYRWHDHRHGSIASRPLVRFVQ